MLDRLGAAPASEWARRGVSAVFVCVRVGAPEARGIDAAAAGDLAAAKALIPYFDQALGKPTERHEFRVLSSVEEIEQLSTEELESLVARGRARRLALGAVQDPAEDWCRRDPPLGVVEGVADS